MMTVAVLAQPQPLRGQVVCILCSAGGFSANFGGTLDCYLGDGVTSDAAADVIVGSDPCGQGAENPGLTINYLSLPIPANVQNCQFCTSTSDPLSSYGAVDVSGERCVNGLTSLQGNKM